MAVAHEMGFRGRRQWSSVGSPDLHRLHAGECQAAQSQLIQSRTGGPLTHRIFLSPPDVGPQERQALLEAFDSNWIAPLGPEVDAFEADFARAVGVGHAAALSSGTAGLHLALVLLGVRTGDEVFVPEAPWGTATHWLTCLTCGSRAERDCLLECEGGQVASDQVERGHCLPSSSSLTSSDRARVMDSLRGRLEQGEAAS